MPTGLVSVPPCHHDCQVERQGDTSLLVLTGGAVKVALEPDGVSVTAGHHLSGPTCR